VCNFAYSQVKTIACGKELLSALVRKITILKPLMAVLKNSPGREEKEQFFNVFTYTAMLNKSEKL